MKDNIMFIPAIILMVVEAAALIFLITAWFRDKKNAEKEENEDDTCKGNQYFDR